MIDKCNYLTKYGACEFKSVKGYMMFRSCTYDLLKSSKLSGIECLVKLEFDKVKKEEAKKYGK